MNAHCRSRLVGWSRRLRTRLTSFRAVDDYPEELRRLDGCDGGADAVATLLKASTFLCFDASDAASAFSHLSMTPPRSIPALKLVLLLLCVVRSRTVLTLEPFDIS